MVREDDAARGVRLGGGDDTARSRYRRKHALCIGIDRYEHWTPLGNGCADANAVADELENEFGFTVSRLLEHEATRDNISRAIQDELRKEVEEDDLVVVFFAGHGHTELLSGKDHGFIVPVEAPAESLSALIKMDQLSRWTSFLNSRHILYIFDCCFSGLATVRSGSLRLGHDLMGRRARIALTAGGKDQTVVDQGWGDNSVFTGHLLLGLRGAAAQGGVVTAASLFSYLARSVPQHSAQTPAMGSLPGHEGGDVLLRVLDSPAPSVEVAARAAPVTESTVERRSSQEESDGTIGSSADLAPPRGELARLTEKGWVWVGIVVAVAAFGLSLVNPALSAAAIGIFTFAFAAFGPPIWWQVIPWVVLLDSLFVVQADFPPYVQVTLGTIAAHTGFCALISGSRNYGAYMRRRGLH